MAAYEATKKSGFYDKNPGREKPIKQMMGKEPTENSKGVRLVNLPQVRDIQNEEIEKMLAGKQDAQQALDNAVRRSQRGDQGSGEGLPVGAPAAAIGPGDTSFRTTDRCLISSCRRDLVFLQTSDCPAVPPRTS